MYFPKEKISSCEIAGAIALSALHDLRINLFRFEGFPQISVFEASDNRFKIFLLWTNNQGKINSVEFYLEDKIAFKAAKQFKKNKIEDSIFEPIQKALAKLEFEFEK